jgi:hypothetical protein
VDDTLNGRLIDGLISQLMDNGTFKMLKAESLKLKAQGQWRNLERPANFEHWNS